MKVPPTAPAARVDMPSLGAYRVIAATSAFCLFAGACCIVTDWVSPVLARGILSLVGLECLFLGVVSGLSARANRPWIGASLAADEEGIHCVHGGHRTMTIPWSRYGGIRKRRKSMMLHCEILDKQGMPLLEAPAWSELPTIRQTEPLAVRQRWLFFSEMRARAVLPLDARTVGEEFFPTPKSMPKALRWFQIVIGLAGVVAVSWLLRVCIMPADSSPPSEAWRLRITSGPALFLQFAIAAASCVSLVAGLRGLGFPRPQKAYEKLEILDEGPTQSAFLRQALKRGVPLEWKPGGRYRIADPKARIRAMTADANALKLFATYLAGVMAFAGAMGGFVTGRTEVLPVLGFIVVLSAGGILLTERITNHLVANVHDTIVYDGHLIVVHSNGTHETFPEPKKKTMRTDSCRLLRNGIRFYLLDEPHLYEAPLEASLLHHLSPVSPVDEAVDGTLNA